MAKNLSRTKSTTVDVLAIISLLLFGSFFVVYLIALAVNPTLREVKPIPMLQGALFLWFAVTTFLKAMQHHNNKDKYWDLVTLSCACIAVLLFFGFQ